MHLSLLKENLIALTVTGTNNLLPKDMIYKGGRYHEQIHDLRSDDIARHQTTEQGKLSSTMSARGSYRQRPPSMPKRVLGKIAPTTSVRRGRSVIRQKLGIAAAILP